MFIFLRFTLVAAAGLSRVCDFVIGDANTNIVYKVCNEKTFHPFDFSDDCWAVVLGDVEENTPKEGYNYYSASTGFPKPCYGHAACKGTLTQSDCHDCLEVCEVILHKMCYWSIG